jgi:hypothetical protein
MKEGVRLRPFQFRAKALVPRMISWGGAVLGLVAVAVFFFIAVVHLADNYHVDHIAGAWMALTAYAHQGVLYPPHYGDGFFGGTRYGPTGIMLNAAAAATTGEYLTSGKTLALLVMAAVLVLVYRIARDVKCGRAAAAAVVGAVIANYAAEFAGTSIYGDALAVALQLAGIAVIVRRDDRVGAALAGTLVAVAVTAKVSGLWGGAAILIWLILRNRRSIVAFVVASGATAIALFGLGALVSEGRMMENLVKLTGSGLNGFPNSLGTLHLKTADLLVHNAIGTTLLLPFAFIALGIALSRRAVDIVDLAFVCSCVLTLVTLTDVGAGFNHLLDLAVLVPLQVAGVLRRLRTPFLHAVMLAALATATGVALFDLRHDLKQAAIGVASGHTPEVLVVPALDGVLAEPFLSEDPSLAVERGQRPVILDAFMLLRIFGERPDLEQRFVERLDSQEFATVVLIMDLNLDDVWWSESHFGAKVAGAIDRNYVMARKVQGPVFRYRILEPRRR